MGGQLVEPGLNTSVFPRSTGCATLRSYPIVCVGSPPRQRNAFRRVSHRPILEVCSRKSASGPVSDSQSEVQTRTLPVCSHSRANVQVPQGTTTMFRVTWGCLQARVVAISNKTPSSSFYRSLGNNRFLMIRGRYRTAVSKVWLVGSHSPLLLVAVCELAEDAGHQGEKYRRPSIKNAMISVNCRGETPDRHRERALVSF